MYHGKLFYILDALSCTIVNCSISRYVKLCHGKLFYIPDALKLYRGKLTAFEQTEILDYPEIWFLGLEAKKIEGVPGGAQNNGYDDENGSYIKVSCSHWVLPWSRYKKVLFDFLVTDFVLLL